MKLHEYHCDPTFWIECRMKLTHSARLSRRSSRAAALSSRCVSSPSSTSRHLLDAPESDDGSDSDDSSDSSDSSNSSSSESRRARTSQMPKLGQKLNVHVQHGSSCLHQVKSSSRHCVPSAFLGRLVRCWAKAERFVFAFACAADPELFDAALLRFVDLQSSLVVLVHHRDFCGCTATSRAPNSSLQGSEPNSSLQGSELATGVSAFFDQHAKVQGCSDRVRDAVFSHYEAGIDGRHWRDFEAFIRHVRNAAPRGHVSWAAQLTNFLAQPTHEKRFNRVIEVATAAAMALKHCEPQVTSTLDRASKSMAKAATKFQAIELAANGGRPIHAFPVFRVWDYIQTQCDILSQNAPTSLPSIGRAAGSCGCLQHWWPHA